MRRIVVVSSSGSGKTTVAAAIADILGLPHLELDSVMHRGGWDSARGPEFSSEMAVLAQGDRWVIDGNYTSHGTREACGPGRTRWYGSICPDGESCPG